jgi:hypothetical protein
MGHGLIVDVDPDMPPYPILFVNHSEPEPRMPAVKIVKQIGQRPPLPLDPAFPAGVRTKRRWNKNVHAALTPPKPASFYPVYSVCFRRAFAFAFAFSPMTLKKVQLWSPREPLNRKRTLCVR